jgi:hypothetical protein
MNTSQEGIDAKLPSQAAIKRYQKLFRQAEAAQCASASPDKVSNVRPLRAFCGNCSEKAPNA